MTHAELVEAARLWLLGTCRCSVVITEMDAGYEEADAIGWQGAWSVLVECKATRADFRAEARKPSRRGGSGRMGVERWYLTPPALLKPEEVPPGWGLVEYDGRRCRRLVRPDPAATEWRSPRSEMALLVSAIRRLGVRSDGGVSVRVYTYRTKNRATLTVAEEG